MKKVYLGCFLSKSIEEDYLQTPKNQYVISTTTFQRALVSSLKDWDDISIINAPDMGSWPKRSSWLRFKGRNESIDDVQCTHVPFLNLTYFKQYSIYASLFRELDKWARKEKGEKLIIVYSLIHSYIKVAVDIKRKHPKTNICCIVLDLPEYFGDSSSLLSKVLSKTEDIYNLTSEIDSFVLLTEQMSEALNTKERPWLLMEGIYKPIEIPVQKKNPKTILYTGKLDARFGLRELVDSFMSIKDNEAKLWICGNGLDKDYVIDAMNKDSRIVYYGVVKQEEVFKMQRQASILINPRRPEGEYTKYSFPSKTMEYLASGTPTIMYRLPGMPDEYLPFIEIIDEKSPNGLRETLVKMLSLSQDELELLGARARDFILQNKTAEIQMNRFYKFIKKHHEK